MRRPLLYVCAPVRTATVSERLAVLDLRRVALGLGWVPVWGPSVLEGLGLDDERPADRVLALEADLELLKKCDAIVIVGSRITQGMHDELNTWTTLGRSRPLLAAEIGPSNPTVGPPR